MFFSDLKETDVVLPVKQAHRSDNNNDRVVILLNQTTLVITQNNDIESLFHIISLFCNTHNTLQIESRTGSDDSSNENPYDELLVTKDSPHKITITGPIDLLDQIFPDLGIIVNEQKKKKIK